MRIICIIKRFQKHLLDCTQSLPVLLSMSNLSGASYNLHANKTWMHVDFMSGFHFMTRHNNWYMITITVIVYF